MELKNKGSEIVLAKVRDHLPDSCNPWALMRQLLHQVSWIIPSVCCGPLSYAFELCSQHTPSCMHNAWVLAKLGFRSCCSTRLVSSYYC